MRLLMAFLISHFSFLISAAQTLTGRAPGQVAVGQQFRLSYTVNTQDVSGFRAGKMPEGIEVLYGPSTSSQTSIQMINGRTTNSSSVTYTYIVIANKAGSFVIPPAQVNAGGKVLTSNELHVKASGTAQSGSAQGGSSQGGSSQGGYSQGRGDDDLRPSGSSISGGDLFIRVSANKRRVYEQEPILLTYKVYTLVQLTDLSGKMPDLKNFYTREVPLPQQKSFQLEMLNGRPYRTVTWSQYAL